MKKVEEKLGFDRIRETIADRCSTDYAAGRCEGEVFCTDPREIRRRLALTDEMRLILMFEDNFPTGGYIDALPFLEPVEKGSSIDLLSLGKLRTLLETTRKILRFFGGVKDGVYPNLQHETSKISFFPDIYARIETILDRHGEIKDTASDALYEIRKKRKALDGQVSKRMNQILRQAQADGLADADASVAIRDGKMLIPVTAAKKRSLPGFVHDESASGKTAFIEPAEIVELNNEINELIFAESREISRILDAFAEFIRPYVPELKELAIYSGETDFIMAKARTALDMVAGMPLINEDGSLLLRKARHPLLEKALRKERKEIVPLTITLSPEKHILLISGPNAGGKSVCMKTCGLLQYMFQWGMLIPTSETSELPVFEKIMVSIGDDQSIDDDLSTYSSFLTDMKAMLQDADERTLVLIDEFGSGTEPAAGGAIAEAILAELDRRGVYGIITTHYTNLKLYAAGDGTGVINGAMLFDERNIAPLFKLETGLPGNSFAFSMARKMGLPENIVKDAEQRSGEEFAGIERNLRKIARNRRVLDEKIQKIRTTDKTLESLTGKYQKELEDIKQTREKILREAREEADEIIKGANRQVEKTIRTIRETQAEKTATHEARQELRDFLGALQQTKQKREDYIEGKLQQVGRRLEKSRSRKKAAAPQGEKEHEEQFRSAPLSVGEKVRIKDNGMVGEVIRVSAGLVTVIVGSVTTKIPKERVERISSNEFKAAQKPSARPLQKYDAALSERKRNFSTEIDLRGQRVGEALENVQRYLDDAIMLGVPSVRILHGKGTGALREEIQKYARTVLGVASATDEDIRFGGSGVTVVRFD